MMQWQSRRQNSFKSQPCGTLSCERLATQARLRRGAAPGKVAKSIARQQCLSEEKPALCSPTSAHWPPLPPQPGFCHQSGDILGSGVLPSALIPPSNKRFLSALHSWPQEQVVALQTFALFLCKADVYVNGRFNGRLCKQNFQKRIKGEICQGRMGKRG